MEKNTKTRKIKKNTKTRSKKGGGIGTSKPKAPSPKTEKRKQNRYHSLIRMK